MEKWDCPTIKRKKRAGVYSDVMFRKKMSKKFDLECHPRVFSLGIDASGNFWSQKKRKKFLPPTQKEKKKFGKIT